MIQYIGKIRTAALLVAAVNGVCDMFQQILAVVLLAIGLIYGAAAIYISYRNRDKLAAERGNIFVLAAAEVAIYICASVGLSNYILNTLLFKHVVDGDDRLLPGTLVAGCVTPGAIIAFSLLRADSNPIDTKLLIVCAVSVIAGSIAGSKSVGMFDSARIRKIMQVALIFSFIVLVVRNVVSIGSGNEATSLEGFKLVLAAILCFITTAINMFGIPMKPTWTAMFLMLGLSSLTALSLVLFFGSIAPLVGGIRALRANRYHGKMVLCTIVMGSVGAILGTMLAISIPSKLLNILLLAVMLIAIITMSKKSKK